MFSNLEILNIYTMSSYQVIQGVAAKNSHCDR